VSDDIQDLAGDPAGLAALSGRYVRLNNGKLGLVRAYVAEEDALAVELLHEVSLQTDTHGRPRRYAPHVSHVYIHRKDGALSDEFLGLEIVNAGQVVNIGRF